MKMDQNSYYMPSSSGNQSQLSSLVTCNYIHLLTHRSLLESCGDLLHQPLPDLPGRRMQDGYSVLLLKVRLLCQQTADRSRTCRQYLKFSIDLYWHACGLICWIPQLWRVPVCLVIPLSQYSCKVFTAADDKQVTMLITLQIRRRLLTVDHSILRSSSGACSQRNATRLALLLPHQSDAVC